MEGHLEEQDIDLLILSPEKLAPERRQLLESHLAECSLCSEMAAFLRSFYDELGKHTLESQDRVEQFLADLKHRRSVVQLFPYQFVPTTEVGGQLATVLAAKSDPKPSYRYSSVCTLASRDEKTVVRILRDEESRNYRLFLLSSGFEPDLRAIIHFPALDINVSVRPESPQAEFHLPASTQHVDWSSIVAELRFTHE